MSALKKGDWVEKKFKEGMRKGCILHVAPDEYFFTVNEYTGFSKVTVAWRTNEPRVHKHTTSYAYTLIRTTPPTDI